MNLEEEVSAELTQRAETQDTSRPDTATLIRDGRSRRNRRHRTRIYIAAAAVLLIAGAAYGVIRADLATTDQTDGQPSTTTPQTYRDENGATLEPGTYTMFVGVGADGTSIDADLTFNGIGWKGGVYPVLFDAGRFGGVVVYQPTALAAGTGCVTEEPNTAVGETSRSLVRQLARLPRSTVVEAPAPVERFGLDAIHLKLQIDNDCGVNGYRVAETLRGNHGISFNNAPQGVIVDFWVADVEGVPIVLEMWHENGASSWLVDEISRTNDSITFHTSR